MRPILDQRLVANLGDYFPSVCTIKLVPITQSASHQDIHGTPVAVVGLRNIPCRIGPLILIRPTDTEIRTQGATEQYTARQLKLNGYFPDIQPRIHVAEVDGIIYPIRGIEHDGDTLTTRLRLEVLKPRA